MCIVYTSNFLTLNDKLEICIAGVIELLLLYQIYMYTVPSRFYETLN